LVAPIILEAFSFVDPFVSNVLSFNVSIVDPTSSLATLAISRDFYFVSSIVEPTFSFVSPTFSFAFPAFS
jgi:hypothetical protein